MTMLERCARAIYAEAEKEDYVSYYGFHDGETCLDGNFDLTKFARAVLEAMREPTDVLLAEGGRACGDERGNADETQFRAVWQAAIDTVLSGRP